MLSSLNSLTSHYDVTVPSDGSWGADYDVWTSNDKYEIMLWMNYRGSVGPIASSYSGGVAQVNIANKTVGGHKYSDTPDQKVMNMVEHISFSEPFL